MFVGEAPGADEDRQGRPFVGRSGQLLTKMIEGMGMAREDVYIANVLKCRPPNNRDPAADEVEKCRPYLLRQIDHVRPKVICALGRHALHALTGYTGSLGQVRGRPMEFHGRRVVPTYHPAYLLRNPSAKRDAWEDLKAVLRLLGRPIPEVRRAPPR
jgi:DNA polymerase